MMKKWVSVELTQPDFVKFRVFLKERKIKYEPSGAGNMVHVEACVDDKEKSECDAFLKYL